MLQFSPFVLNLKIGLFNKSTEADTLRVNILGASGALKLQNYGPLTSRFLVRSFAPFTDYYFYVTINNNIANTWLTNTVIDGIDIWYTDEGPVITK